ncbi:Ig-like domain-containing protein [Mesonia aestuariivivens]|uniref:Ig-like domain-containing protein n=1 Tax=Mesonia aestuariivivens TaxID=2796128 RepID=A0ABS6W240_9FLAO|nr:Ig-like domain-containing protein [Mesonia aestuariivivens]MBW2961925.1 Ig-like domain-containing protein [Mesonia aestuariivivens]
MNFKRFTYFFLAFISLSFLFNCAKRGMPTGGDLDTIPPAFINALPENYSTKFKAEEIRIKFDEYIKLKDPQRQIIVSPPMDPKPELYPMGSASENVRIKITDTLQENTTYTINFGNSIVDNNEGNPLPFFKYVFSTGAYVDSLMVKGSIKDAYQPKTDEFISVMLYEIDSTFNDSVVFNKMPTYISYTQDTLNTFSVENMKEGKYKMVAILDKNQNYKFDPRSDKIGFVDSLITLPTNKNIQISIFKEVLDFQIQRPKQISKQHLIFGYRGNPEETQIELISEKPADFDYKIIKDREKDTLHYWFKPYKEVDSLLFKVTHQKYTDTVYTKIRDMKKDSLEITPLTKGSFDVDKDFKITANLPLVKLDSSYITIINQDSIAIPFQYQFEEFENTYALNFEKEQKQIFNIKLLPGAITDFYEHTNDTLNFKIKTPDFADLGVLNMTITNLKSYPVIAQLTNNKGEVYKEVIHQENEGNVLNFKYINPGKYLLRIIYDENNNGAWDTGNYLQKTQPEEIIYYPKEIEIRANWDVMETFKLN